MAAFPEEPKCGKCGGYIYTCVSFEIDTSVCTCKTEIIEDESELPEVKPAKQRSSIVTARPRVQQYVAPVKSTKDFNRRRL